MNYKFIKRNSNNVFPQFSLFGPFIWNHAGLDELLFVDGLLQSRRFNSIFMN